MQKHPEKDVEIYCPGVVIEIMSVVQWFHVTKGHQWDQSFWNSCTCTCLVYLKLSWECPNFFVIIGDYLCHPVQEADILPTQVQIPWYLFMISSVDRKGPTLIALVLLPLLALPLLVNHLIIDVMTLFLWLIPTHTLISKITSSLRLNDELAQHHFVTIWQLLWLHWHIIWKTILRG